MGGHSIECCSPSAAHRSELHGPLTAATESQGEFQASSKDTIGHDGVISGSAKDTNGLKRDTKSFPRPIYDPLVRGTTDLRYTAIVLRLRKGDKSEPDAQPLTELPKSQTDQERTCVISFKRWRC